MDEAPGSKFCEEGSLLRHAVSKMGQYRRNSSGGERKKEGHGRRRSAILSMDS